MAAKLAMSQADAADNCRKSPAELSPYANTLMIQQMLAAVCPSQSMRKNRRANDGVEGVFLTAS